MKAVILAGGYGSRIGEELGLKPKPMIEIGGKPILWHIMKLYSHYGINDFVVLLGYKGYIIKEYFANYFLHQSDVTIDLSNNDIKIHKNNSEPWRVTLIDTGVDTKTGGRIKMAQPYLDNETFMLTYGDGVSDINIKELLNFHIKNNRYATISVAQPLGRLGDISLDKQNNVITFNNKTSCEDNTWIKCGFCVMEPQIFGLIKDHSTVFEDEVLDSLSKENQLGGYKHRGFFKGIVTPRDQQELEYLWNSGNHPWKVWE